MGMTLGVWRQRAAVISAVCFLLLVCIVAARAEASVEFCPAVERDMLPITGSLTLYAFDLGADTERTASGVLAIETERGWYRSAFGPVDFTKKTYHYHNAFGDQGAKPEFRSPVLYVRFPQDVHVLNQWVESASSQIATWSSRGSVKCYPGPRPDPTNKYQNELDPADASSFTMEPPASAPVQLAQAVPLIETTNCQNPFLEAKIVELGSVAAPSDDDAQSPAAVKVAVSPDGKVAEATVFQSSGSLSFDESTRRLALRSTYAPAIAYCRPRPGFYVLRVGP